MRNTYLKEVYNIAKKDKNVLSLVSDNGMIVYDDFRRDLPNQYFNFGISEGHMITASSRNGKLWKNTVCLYNRFFFSIPFL